MPYWQVRFAIMAGDKKAADARVAEVLKREKARRQAVAVRSSATQAVTTAVEGGAPRVAVVPHSSPTEQVVLTEPSEALALVQQRLPSLFVAMVEGEQGLLDALRTLGISSATFFTALDASSELRNWYRGVKAAQAVVDVEKTGEVLRELDEVAGDELVGNGVRNAKVQAANHKLSHYRWMAQRLLPAMFGEKTQAETHSKIEIVVRREVKKAVKEAVEDE